MPINFAPFAWYNGKVIDKNELPTESIIHIIEQSFTLHSIYWCKSAELIFPEQVLTKISLEAADYNLSLTLFNPESSTSLQSETHRIVNRNRAFKFSKAHFIAGTNKLNKPFECIIIEPLTTHPAIGSEITIADTVECATWPLDKAFRLSAISNPLKQLMKREITEDGLNDGIVLNQKGFVSQALSGSLFAVHQNRIVTPSIQAGAPIDIIRSYTLMTLRKRNIEVQEIDEMTVSIIEESDELFSASIEHGYCAFKGFRDFRYYDIIRKSIVEELIGY